MQQLKLIFSKAIYRVLGVLVIVFIGIQFIGPSVSNPPVTHPFKAPKDVAEILKRACYDCHSNQTNPSWESRVAPFSWVVASEVQTARSRFNFSTFDTLTPAQQQGFVWEMVNMVLDHKMPLPSYTFLHSSARLSSADVNVLKDYARSLNPSVYHDSAAIHAAAIEDGAIAETTFKDPKEALPVAANGVSYVKDFRNWQVISTTNRFDNNRSIRVVYANPVAAAAVRNNQVKPWPEGSVIVKVVWDIIEEKNGDILPGKFNNVQIMEKDSKRFKDSQGWGFAKFNGMGRVPYGENASFNRACFNCHKAAGETGYVFNIPLPNGELLAVNQF